MVESTVPKEIKFYRQNAAYGFMSNFYPSPFVDDEGREWPTTEHYFQAMKHHSNADYVEEIRTAKKPKDAFNLGRARTGFFRSDWETVKDEVMLTCLRWKYT